MAETNIYSHIIELASSSEPTPELKNYWQKRYTVLLTAGVFELSSKTVQAFSEEVIISTPVTPFGEVDLLSHIDQNGMFDEMKLQITIEYSIRLLDSLIAEHKFSPGVYKTLNFYRKIGIGLKNFKEYIKIRPNSSEVDQIDYIGHLVSTFAYRESENLATEKGVSGWWNQSRKILKPRQFELWVNPETGETKTALELCETFDSRSIMETDWEIQPRRNSHLLILPAETEWEIWSDRFEPSTNVKPAEEATFVPAPQPVVVEKPVEIVQPTLPEITIPVHIDTPSTHPDKLQEITEENPYLTALEEAPLVDFKYIKPSEMKEISKPNSIVQAPKELLTTEVIQDGSHLLEQVTKVPEIQPSNDINNTTKVETPIQSNTSISSTISPSINNTSMSKYSLSLNKTVSTNSFGNVSVALAYSAQGLQTISINPSESTPEAKYLLDLVLNLVHFSLSKGVTLSEVAQQIQNTPAMGSTAELVQVVVEVLSTAPAHVNEINSEIIE